MRTVTCNGCFDALHPGHLFFLGYALAQGDELIVGINSDDYIIRNKRSNPHRNQKERKSDLLSLGFIKNVIIFPEDSPIEFIRIVRPDVHCTGEEYRNSCREERVCKDLGIRLIFVPRIGDWSSSCSE